MGRLGHSVDWTFPANIGCSGKAVSITDSITFFSFFTPLPERTLILDDSAKNPG